MYDIDERHCEPYLTVEGKAHAVRVEAPPQPWKESDVLIPERAFEAADGQVGALSGELSMEAATVH